MSLIANSISTNSVTTGNAEERFDGGDVRIGLNDKVDVTVTRKRLYGTIIESSGRETKSITLYFLNFLAIPLNANGKSFFLIHIIFIVFLAFLLYITIKKARKNDFERGFV